jgi:pimeloyl-ACP methyl ester carboxylesterase
MKKEFTVILKGSEHHVHARLRDGDGELVFFIHGLGCAGEAFDDAFTSPYMKDFSLLAPDLPGFGSSPLPEGFSCSMEDHAAVCLEILRQVDHEKIHVVGHSMGGAVARRLAGPLGERLASFASVEGNLIRRDCSVSRRLAASHGGYRRRLLGMIDAGILTGAERSLFLWKKWIGDSSEEALDRSALSLVDWSCGGRLLAMFRSLRCGKIFIHGERNSSLAVLRMLEGITTASVPGCGHFPMNDNSRDFYRILAEFLQSASD